MDEQKLVKQVGIWRLYHDSSKNTHHIEGLDKRTGIEHIYCFVRVERNHDLLSDSYGLWELYSPYAHNIVISKAASNAFINYLSKDMII